MPTVAEYKSQAEEFERNGQLAKARAVYEHLIKHLEASAAIWKELSLYVKAGDVASQLGDAEGAMGLFERAAERYAELGEVERVIALCRKVLKEDPERLSVYRRLAGELLKHNYIDQARRLMLDLARHSGRQATIDQLERLAMEPPADVRAAIEKGFAEPVEEAASAEARAVAEEEDEESEEEEPEAEEEEEKEKPKPAAEDLLVVRTAADDLRADVGAPVEDEEEEEGVAVIEPPKPAPAEPEPPAVRTIEQEGAQAAEEAEDVEEAKEVEEAEETPAEAPGLAGMLSGTSEPPMVFLDLGDGEESTAVEPTWLEPEQEEASVPAPRAEPVVPVETPKKKKKQKKKKPKKRRRRRRREIGPRVRIAAVVVLVVGAGAALFTTGVVSVGDLPLVGGGAEANTETQVEPMPAGEPTDPRDENEYIPGGPEPAPTIALEAFPPVPGRP